MAKDVSVVMVANAHPPAPYSPVLGGRGNSVSFLEDLMVACQDWSFVLLVFVGGLESGIISAWQGVLTQVRL